MRLERIGIAGVCVWLTYACAKPESAGQSADTRPPAGIAGASAQAVPPAGTSMLPVTSGGAGSLARAMTSTPSAAGALPPAAPAAAGSGAASAPPPAAAGAAGAPARGTPAGAPAVVQLGAACAGLVRCCVTLTDPAQRRACEAVADAAQETPCQAVTVTYCSASTSLPSPATAPITPPPVVPPAITPPPPVMDNCMALEACCATLTDEDDQEYCEEPLEDADPMECAAALADYCPGMAPAQPTTTTPATAMACVMLDMCCARVRDDDDQEDCQEVVDDADVQACQDAQVDFCR